MSLVQEIFGPIPMAANSSFKHNGHYIAGFLCTVSGTLTITSDPDNNGVAPVWVSALPVNAGFYVPIPIRFDRPVTVALSGGAAGTLLA